MKNYKSIFYSESIFVIGILYLFFYGLFHSYLSESFLGVATILNIIVPIANIISLIALSSLGVNFKSLQSLIKDKKNPAGIIIRYFSYYLMFAFPTNLVIFVIFGDKSDYAIWLLFLVNFILLTPFAIIGVIKGFLQVRKM